MWSVLPLLRRGRLGTAAPSQSALSSSRHPLSTIHHRAFSSVAVVKAAASSSPSPDNALSSSPLKDSFHRQHTYLRVSLTERCSLRCTYCMPEEGVPLTPKEQLLTAEEIKRLLKWFVSHGVTKVRFTGGEPLVRHDIADIVAAAGELRPLGLQTIALTTNGLVLGRKLDSLVHAGLTNINISLDTLDPLKFELIARRRGHDKVLSALHRALAAAPPLRSVKLNCVVMKGINDEELSAFVQMTEEHDFEVRFIEYMPFDGNRWKNERFLGYRDMLAVIRRTHPTLELLPSPDPHAVSKVYAVPGWKGRVGFISSMSDHFCDSCNRLRITADGQLKVCLFDNKEVSLRDALRQGISDEELSSIVAAAVRGKKRAHAGMFELASSKNRPMITIGG